VDLITKVTPNAKMTAPKETSCAQGGKREDIGMKYLPKFYQEGFRLSVIPFIHEAMGSTIGPWDAIPENEIRYAWS